MNILKCPACGAPITSKNGMLPNFCEYCGQRLEITDTVNRSEHLYHRVDEARIREAEVRMKEAEIEEKREAARARRETVRDIGSLLVIIVPRLMPLLFVAVMFFSCRAMFKKVEINNAKMEQEREEEDAREEQIEKNVSSQIMTVCKNNGATIEDIHAFGDTVHINVVASDGSKGIINALQEAIVNGLDLDDGMEADISIEYPENHTVRWFRIDAYGQVKVESDKTNSISEEESKDITNEYKEKLESILDEYGAGLLSAEYEGDVLYLTIKSSTSEKGKIDNLVHDISDLNKSLKSLSMDIIIKTESDESLRSVAISSDQSIEIESDYTNEMSDEDVNDIIDDYLPSLSKACKKHDANITEITIRNDTLYVYIAAGYEREDKIKELEKSVNKVITDKKRINARFDVSDEDSISTTKEWTIDKNGIIDVWYDFTEPGFPGL